MMAIDGNKLELIEQSVTRIHQAAQSEQFELPAPLHDTPVDGRIDKA
jgi:hypothetical protein